MDKQGKPVWRICVTVGTETYVDKSGKERKVQRHVHGTLAEARRQLKDLQEDCQKVDPKAVKKRTTFADACDSWENSMRNSGRASTNALRGYLTNLGHMRARIGDKELTKVTTQDVEAALVAIRAERKLSGTTMRKVYTATKRVFAYACDLDWMVRNPCDRIDAPRNDAVVNRRSPSKEECRKFAEELDKAERRAIEEFDAKERCVKTENNAYGRTIVWGISDLSCIMALRLELATGMRRPEVLGLTWKCVDFERSTVTVRQAVIEEGEVKKQGKERSLEVRGTKTYAGTRQISIDSGTKGRLVIWKVQQAKLLSLINPGGVPLEQNEDTPVCIGDKESWLPPSRITHWWSGASKGKGFRDEIGFPGLLMHELRHTQATQLLGEGVDVKTVQTRMGHAKASHTLDLYAHAIPANNQNAADVMGGLTRGASRRGAMLADRHQPKRRGNTTSEERRARRETRRAKLPA